MHAEDFQRSGASFRQYESRKASSRHFPASIIPKRHSIKKSIHHIHPARVVIRIPTLEQGGIHFSKAVGKIQPNGLRVADPPAILDEELTAMFVLDLGKSYEEDGRSREKEHRRKQEANLSEEKQELANDAYPPTKVFEVDMDVILPRMANFNARDFQAAFQRISKAL